MLPGWPPEHPHAVTQELTVNPYFFELLAEERRQQLDRRAEALRIAHTTEGRATGANPWRVRLFPWGRAG